MNDLRESKDYFFQQETRKNILEKLIYIDNINPNNNLQNLPNNNNYTSEKNSILQNTQYKNITELIFLIEGANQKVNYNK